MVKLIIALEKSIKHWERLRAGLEFKFGVSDCALCSLYNTVDNRCGNCPVYAQTDELGCVDTPHGDLWDHVDLVHVQDLGEGTVANCTECQKHIDAEIVFLKSLRENDNV